MVLFLLGIVAIFKSSIVYQSPINHLFLARGFVIEKFSKVFINLKKSVVIKGVTHAVTFVDTEPFLNRRLPAHAVPSPVVVAFLHPS